MVNKKASIHDTPQFLRLSESFWMRTSPVLAFFLVVAVPADIECPTA